MSSDSKNDSHQRPGWLALTAGGLFLAAHALLPMWLGDVYPFTSAPMFRDNPQTYCNYRVYGPDGSLLPAKDFLIQRIYDGNPVGYGVGIVPPPVLERFGEVLDEATIRQHIEQQLTREANRGYAFVEIEQEVIGPVDGQRLGVVKKERWRVGRLSATAQPYDASTQD